MNKLPFEKIERKIIVKKESKTKSNFGKKPGERDIKELIRYGVVNINKPPGPTSHQVSDYVKKILNIKRCGHAGTLDPKVVGCLPIALDSATRIVQVLLSAGKEYVCLMHLHKEIPQSKIHNVMKEFVGKIKQIPPVRSAVKRYERTRKIYYIEIMEIDGRDVLFRVGCEAGTYIRKLVWQIGHDLGVGAHMKMLVRTKAGPFSDKEMVTLHDLKDAYEFYKEGREEEIKKIIRPFEDAVEHLGKIWVLDSTVDPLCYGADLYVVGISKLNDKINKGDIVAIFTLKNELICLGKAEMTTEEMMKKEKGTAVETSKVFMDRGVYHE